jgi:lysophospholipase L1-like esterase
MVLMSLARRTRTWIASLTLSVFLSAFSATIEPPSASAAAPSPADRWARHYHDRVAQFEEANARPNLVMVGSSHIEGFDARWLPGWQVTNRGIAADRIGLTERGILHRLESSVFNCAPDVIVLQNGANDLGELWRHGTPAMDEIETCYREVVSRIRTRLPNVPLVIVGMLPTRDRYAGLVPLLQQLDERLQRIAGDAACTFLRVYPDLADQEGLLRAAYSRDGLHLNSAGYRVWAKRLAEALDGLRLPQHASAAPPRSDLAGQWAWHDAQQLVIEGKGWNDTQCTYQRLPDRAEGQVPAMVWTLARRPAGIAIRFSTDSARIAAAWDGGGAMNHMAATGNSGLDLYARRQEGWRFCGVGRPQPHPTTVELARDLPAGLTEYLLYLPLYSPLDELRIGIAPDAVITRPPPRPVSQRKPIVFYGTSITQGGCAARAGMCHPAMLGRWLDREVINLGFSGSGKMEPALAHLLAELDPAVYVLECLPNMTTPMVRERVVPFVRILRAARPATPVLLVESPFNLPANPDNAALREAFTALTAEGVKHLHYLPGDGQLAGRENGTVDGVHPTDLGFFEMAVAYEPVLKVILASTPER